MMKFSEFAHFDPVLTRRERTPGGKAAEALAPFIFAVPWARAADSASVGAEARVLGQ